MEGPSNGGVLYHEVQESKLCAVHCVNAVLQGPFFSEFDLAALASDLDNKERLMMFCGGAPPASANFLSEDSHNVSLEGDFSIQVLQKALEVWDLQVIPLDSPVAEPAQFDPESENAFICHLENHWFCIRKVNGEWYNFDSLLPAPQHLSKFYLSAYLDSLKGFGWSIFLVRGNFPKECPLVSSEASNGYGQWLTPEDAERINKSCSNSTPAPQRPEVAQQPSGQILDPREAELLAEMEDEELKAAIAASLMDSSPAMANTEAARPVDSYPAVANSEAAIQVESSPAMGTTNIEAAIQVVSSPATGTTNTEAARQVGSSPATADTEAARPVGSSEGQVNTEVAAPTEERLR